MSDYSIVIPAFNEAADIGSTLAAIRSWALDAECIVVDDGSTDHTSHIAREWADQVIRLPRNQGKGRALQAGWTQAKGGIIMFLDADLRESAGHAWRLLGPIREGECDMTIAVLPRPAQAGGWGMAKSLARRGIRWMTGYDMIAPLSGQRAIRREVLQAVKQLDHGFGIEVGLTVDALRAGFSVRELPVQLTHRVTQNDMQGMLHRGKEFLAVGQALRCRWREQERLNKW